MRFMYVVLIFALLNKNSYAEFIPQLWRNDASLCAVNTRHHERQNSIPTALLSAISKVESGRYHTTTNQTYAWPWTINVGGEGRFFATKSEAVRHVRNLLARGVSSIDVGCMQVNLRHHPNAFQNIEAAFDPALNTAYAARYLTDLKNNLGSWHRAVAHYHSANAIYHVPYRARVYKTWLKEQDYNANGFQQGHEVTQIQKGVPLTNAQAKLYIKNRGRKQQFVWQLSNARQELMQYKARAINTLAQYKNADTGQSNQDVKLQPAVIKQPRRSLTSKLMIRSNQMQPYVIKK